MRKTILCPNCGTEIKLEDDTYSSIANQVRNEEFEDELEKRLATERQKNEAKIKLALSNAEIEHQKALAEKDEKILALNKSKEHVTNEAFKAISKRDKALSELKESSSAEIARLTELLNNSESDKTAAISTAIAKVKLDTNKVELSLNKRISDLESMLKSSKAQTAEAIANAVSVEREKAVKTELELAKAKEIIASKEREAVIAKNAALSDKENALSEMNARIIEMKASYSEKETTLTAHYDSLIKAKDDEIAYYKDYKAKLSVKLLGESLEEHCSNEFAKIKPLIKNSSFGKDNLVSKESGSKGDFIFKTLDDDGDILTSIMFDMKNEADCSENKHKNTDYLKELDKDRREKGCEYAILVSMLEMDNELYNQGIVDMSDKYPKMFVIRPQFFIPVIIMLHGLALKTAEYKNQVKELQNQSIDVSNFEDSIASFKDSITKCFDLAGKKKDSAVERLDKAITILQNIKDDIVKFDQHIAQANAKAEKITIKKLTSNAPSIAKELLKAKSSEITNESSHKVSA